MPVILLIPPDSSVATGEAWGHVPPQPQSGRVMAIRGEKIGGGVGVPDHLGQTNYAEICILVTKYISKLNKINTKNTNYMPCIYLHILNTCISIRPHNSVIKQNTQNGAGARPPY